MLRQELIKKECRRAGLGVFLQRRFFESHSRLTLEAIEEGTAVQLQAPSSSLTAFMKSCASLRASCTLAMILGVHPCTRHVFVRVVWCGLISYTAPYV